MEQSANGVEIINEVNKLENMLTDDVKEKENIKKQIERIKELINFMPGAFIDNEAKEARK